MFCNGWTASQLDDSGSGYTIRLEGTRLTIAPDPFEGREVPLEITARELPNSDVSLGGRSPRRVVEGSTSPGAGRRVGYS